MFSKLSLTYLWCLDEGLSKYGVVHFLEQPFVYEMFRNVFSGAFLFMFCFVALYGSFAAICQIEILDYTSVVSKKEWLLIFSGTDMRFCSLVCFFGEAINLLCLFFSSLFLSTLCQWFFLAPVSCSAADMQSLSTSVGAV